ncbi:hypothetical protein GGI42DRAFT_117513 [Trichoderma sp. SZMC 28013]
MHQSFSLPCNATYSLPSLSCMLHALLTHAACTYARPNCKAAFILHASPIAPHHIRHPTGWRLAWAQFPFSCFRCFFVPCFPSPSPCIGCLVRLPSLFPLFGAPHHGFVLAIGCGRAVESLRHLPP